METTRALVKAQADLFIPRCARNKRERFLIRDGRQS